MNLQRILRICACAALLSSAPVSYALAGPCGMQVDEDQRKRAHDRIAELYETRVELTLQDLCSVEPLTDEALASLRTKTSEAVQAFLKEKPVKVIDQGEIAWSANPIRFAPFSEFSASEPWMQVCESAFTEEQRVTLEQRVQARQDRVRNSLAALTGAILNRGLCLSPGELQSIEGVCKATADAKLEQGLIPDSNELRFAVGFDMGGEEDSLPKLLSNAGILEVLSPPRQKILSELLDRGRTEIHDYLLEAEYLLYGREDAAEARRLLSGCAEALVHRDGKAPKKRSRLFLPGNSPSKKKFWNKTLQRVLKLEGEPADLPSRDVAPLAELRSAYVLAVLDRRAVFTEEQRVSLRPLVREIVEIEVGRGRGRPACTLDFPSSLRLSQEDQIVPGVGREGEQRVKLKALVDTLFETCTAEQRDVLGR